MVQEMKKCKSCGREVVKSAKRCPECGARLGMPVWAIILIVIAAFGALMAIGIVACTAGTVATIDSAVKETNAGSDIQTEDGETVTGDEAKTATFKIGKTITVENLEITVSAPKNEKPDEWTDTKSGNVAIFHVKATNKAAAGQAFISDGDFSAYVDGNKCESVYTDATDWMVDAINSGKTAEGNMGFDIPKGSEFELIYTPNFLLDQEITFTGSN